MDSEDRVRKIIKAFSSTERYSSTSLYSVPDSPGIYVLFEKGEHFGHDDKIVYVGITRGNEVLSYLLKSLYTGSKETSNLRRNIGRAILRKEKNEYYYQWLQPMSNDHIGGNFVNRIRTEAKISAYLRDNVSFSFIPISSDEKRMVFGHRLIHSLKQIYVASAPPSVRWLGRHTGVEKLAETGMWQLGEGTVEPLVDEDVAYVFDELGYEEPVKQRSSSQYNSKQDEYVAYVRSPKRRPKKEFLYWNREMFIRELEADEYWGAEEIWEATMKINPDSYDDFSEFGEYVDDQYVFARLLLPTDVYDCHLNEPGFVGLCGERLLEYLYPRRYWRNDWR